MVLFDFYSDYIILLVFVCVSFILSLILSFVPFILGTRTNFLDVAKLSVYECGFDPIEYVDQLYFDIKFYKILILFLVFDIEIIFLLPWAISFNWSIFGNEGFVFFFTGFIFMLILLLGLFYEYSTGLLDW